jgi:hypothetical protein
VDTQISNERRTLVVFSLKIYQTPGVLLLLLYPLILGFGIGIGGPSGIILGVVAWVSTAALIWAASFAAAVSWEGVLLSAEQIRTSKFPRVAVRGHFDLALEFL